ncbi:Gst, Glutathione S-transferase, partial [Pyrenophora tritici-repentis]
LNKSRGQRIVWLLEELHLTYDIAVYKRDANKRAGPELKAIHPLGKSPTVSIRPAGADKDIVIAESEAIVEYICSLFTILITALITSTLKSSPVPFFLKPITSAVASKIDSSFVDPELKSHFDFLENYLLESPSQGKFFCGDDLTAADIMIHFGLEGACQRVGLGESKYPKLYEYMRRLQGREGYVRAAKRVEEVSGEKFVPFSDAKL